MRIAMIGQKGFELGPKGGGVEQHVRELATHLVQDGHEVVVYARRRYATEGAVPPQGIELRYIPTIYRKNLEAIVHAFLCTLDALTLKLDIIHYHGVGPATLAWIPRLFKPRCRVVVTFHSQDRFHQKWGWFARMYLWFGEWAACLFPHATIAVSHTIQVHARRAFHRQIIYIPNGATVQRVVGSDLLASFHVKPSHYLLNVSRLVPHKGQHVLIQAYKRLKALNRTDLSLPKLVFVGAATYTSAYEQQLRDLAAGDPDILFVGYQTGEALRQLFAHAYLYVQPSESEGLPVVVLEAMSFGTPALVSDIPENLEVAHRVGFTFKTNSVEDLAEKLIELIQHPVLVQEAASRSQDVIRDFFRWSLITKQVEDVYRSVRH